LMQNGEFREDLFYRVNVFPIELPPLRERKRDISLLVNHFLDSNAKRSAKPPKRFSRRAMKALMDYNWPGNVRELQNMVERSFTITKDPTIRLRNISSLNIAKANIKDMTLKEAVNLFEQQYIQEVLESVEGNKKKAASILGIHRNTLLAKTSSPGLKK
jgi:two-component system response regulator HydG